MRVAFFTDTFTQFTPLNEKYDSIAWNTGNLLFLNAIKKTIECDIVSSWEDDKMEEYDAFITSDLIWVLENAKPSDRMLNRLKMAKDRPIIPLSVGLQSHTFKPDFNLHPEMLFALKEMESRCVIAVRGEYTADILNRHGVTNVEIVGCPSMYQLPLYLGNLNFLEKEPTASFATANYRSFDGAFTSADRDILRYIQTYSGGFAEQTLLPLTPKMMPDTRIRQWFTRYTYVYFDLDSWVLHNQRYDFSFGLRFHGNIAALLAKVPALFMKFDSRTQEMTDYFSLPTIRADQFSIDEPLFRHAERTDYSAFIRGYRSKLKNYTDFLMRNNLEMTLNFRKRLDNFLVGHRSLEKRALDAL
ncbi:polysaccharide pyruvyl transferase family protein [Rhizobium sp. BK491]|uniref:polysaccharide pyruvyl transferase family protein n=1 Tax=Rhizobium sp. BK491 TaxID=2587009 RepID=UPI001617F334|nr:hypothetical protein [Rhizobium sp. BK491]